MKFNLAMPGENIKAFNFLSELSEKQSVVEVKKISLRRSLSQNNYLHLLIGAFGAHFGYTLDEAKLIYKKISRDLYFYNKKGHVFIRSSADLTKEEMAKTVDAFMKFSANNGYELPLATNQEWLRQIENEVERSNYYL